MAYTQLNQTTREMVQPLHLSPIHIGEALFLSAFRSRAVLRCQNNPMPPRILMHFGEVRTQKLTQYCTILVQLIALEGRRSIDVHCPNITRVTSAEGWLLQAMSGAQSDDNVKLLSGLVGVLDAPPSRYLVKIVRMIAKDFAKEQLSLNWSMPSHGPIYPNSLSQQHCFKHADRNSLSASDSLIMDYVAA